MPIARVAEPRIVHLATVDSTNAEAMRRALAGKEPPFWIVADAQTQGRGRSGRRWSSEPGNLYASLCTRLSTPAPKAYQLSLVAGVAAIEAVERAMTLAPGSGLRLKWPNDILIGTQKAGGILVESSTVPGGLAAVVGIGINLSSHPGALDRPATHLGAHGRAPGRDALISELARAFERWLEPWREGEGFETIRAAWLARAGPIGERLVVNAGSAPVEGSFAGLDADGALILIDPHGETRRFSYGDVTLT